jgi:hypothetical protein
MQYVMARRVNVLIARARPRRRSAVIAIPGKSTAQTAITHLCSTPQPSSFRNQHDNGWMNRMAQAVINL